jgi:hypothetical protein
MQTFTGLQYLKIDIASNFGLDKLDWDDRIAWVDAHEDELETMLPQAAEPALYHAGLQAYRKTQRGEPTGYPISLDAASSGLQILAALVGCKDSASLCGVVSTGHREDAYTRIYGAMCAKIGEAAKIERKSVKTAIMTALYNSTAMPKKIFGEGELLAMFYQTMEEMAPGAWELNKDFKGLWQADALSHDWVLPDNFHVHTPVMTPVKQTVNFLNRPIEVTTTENIGTKEGRALGPNIVHSIDGMIVREMYRRCSFDADHMIELIELIMQSNYQRPYSTTRAKDKLVQTLWAHYERTGFLSARILENLDAKNLGSVDYSVILKLIKSMPVNPFQLIAIHDCFRVHPNYGNDLRQQYNNLLAELADSDLLSDIASQVAGYKIPVEKKGKIAATIREADYALC